MENVTVIGAGSWGTALAVVADRAGHRVTMWSRDLDVVEGINRLHVNPRYLKETSLSERVRATTNLLEAVNESQLVILAIPSHATRLVLTDLADNLKRGTVLVGAAKGIEIETGKRMSQVVDEVFAKHANDDALRYVSLSGPSFAREVVDKHPTAVVAASQIHEDCRLVQSAMSTEDFRVYTNDDLVGVELGGATKNVMAIAAGMVSGLGYGSNTVAALITRGLAEMSRIALAEGARLETLMGLAGLGDLVLTCTGGLSRNRFVGQELGKGRALEEICSTMNETAEGIKTTKAVLRLADQLKVEAPITAEVYAVLYENKRPQDAAVELMTRPLRGEF
jgi:glycerol-3-phosphate dehydrogenase (NAD(P)+)